MIIFPTSCDNCGRLYRESYLFNENNDNGECGFCWCGYCRIKRMVKPFKFITIYEKLNDADPARK